MPQPPAPPPAAVAPALPAPGADTLDTVDATGILDTATYATPALRALVAAAALGNRVPPTLASYRAAVESEIAVSARREDGLEGVFGVEQVASVLRWTRAGYYDQHVVGDRARQTGLNFSLLSLARTGWATPVLYGNRLRLRRDAEGERGRRRRGRGNARAGGADTLPVVHPLAEDRDRYYRYTGGDTVATIAVASAGAAPRRLPIVRVLVEPRGDVPARTGLFRGELDLDATRHAVVRLRGRLLVAGAPARRPRGLAAGVRAVRAALLPQGYAYVEYVNAERADAAGGRYWLPSYQRIELQAGSPALGDARAVVRIVSRFRDVAVNDTALTAAELAADADSILPLARRRLTFARGDSVGRYAGWRAPLGEATGAVHADDFADVGPADAAGAAGAPVAGPPRAAFFVPRSSDLVRFNRVDGLFTGAGGRVRFGGRAPGVALTATAGVGWASGRVRGRVELERRWGAAPGALGAGPWGGGGAGPAWAASLRAGRSLDLTNDFRAPFDSGSSLGALLGVDDYDYVDRRFAGVAVARASAGRALVLRLEAGAAADRPEAARLARGPLTRVAYLANRGADAGRYLRTAVVAEWRRDVAGEFVRPGVGARLLAERGDAVFGAPGLRYTRVEGRVAARRELLGGSLGAGTPGAGPFGWLGTRFGTSTLALAGRADAGLVAGGGAAGPPPQQLFELGRGQNLLGYGYKAFAGDRAAAARGLVLFTGPYLRTPVRRRRYVLPAPAPGAAAGVQLGWAEASGDAARAAVARLGAGAFGGAGQAPRPAGGVRASVSAGATLFGGAVFVGAARAVDGHADRPRGWRGVVTFGQVL